jgi:hypothetical protein
MAQAMGSIWGTTRGKERERSQMARDQINPLLPELNQVFILSILGFSHLIQRIKPGVSK